MDTKKEYCTFENLEKEKFFEILDKISKLDVALVGDVCLDVYWQADMTKSELSRETPHFPLPIVQERMSPGAGGNVAANIVDLGVNSIKVLSVIGVDWRGHELIQQFNMRNIDTSTLITSKELITNAYCKPIRCGISEIEYEDPRLDFANYRELPEKEESMLIENLDKLASSVDVICIADQFAYSCITPKVREKISELSLAGHLIIVDSRDRVNLYNNVTLKPNEVEGTKAVFADIDPRDATFEMQQQATISLHKNNHCNVCMTLGGDGCIYLDDEEMVFIPTTKLEGELDICGAGDTFISAFSCALATGAKGYEAAAFANMASAVTIKKLGMTGTASQGEIITKFNQNLAND